MKKVIGLMAALVLMFSVGNASAWYFDINTGTGDVMFMADGGTLETDNLTLAFAGSPTMVVSDIPTYPTSWGGGGLTDMGIVDNGLAVSQGWVSTGDGVLGLPAGMGNPGGPDMLLLTLTGPMAWDADNLSNMIIVNDYNIGVMLVADLIAGDFLRVDGISIKGGDVPIPGAVYLLASGLIGLVGLRRRMK